MNTGLQTSQLWFHTCLWPQHWGERKQAVNEPLKLQAPGSERDLASEESGRQWERTPEAIPWLLGLCTSVHIHVRKFSNTHIYTHTHEHTAVFVHMHILTNTLLSVCPCSLGLPLIGWSRPCFLCSKALHPCLPLGWFGFLLSPSLCYSSRGNSWQLYFRCGIVELIFPPDKMAVLPSERFLLCLLFFIFEPGCLPSHPFGISLSAVLCFLFSTSSRQAERQTVFLLVHSEGLYLLTLDSITNPSVFTFLLIKIFMCVYGVCVCSKCASQRTALWSWLSPFTFAHVPGTGRGHQVYTVVHLAGLPSLFWSSAFSS